jgi:hypothetical protein
MNSLRSAGAIYFISAVLFVLVVYAMHAGNYLIFDSNTAIGANKAIQITGARLDDWRIAALSTDSGPLGRPLSMLSFALNYVIAGEVSPVQVKMGNALIHVLLGCAVAFFTYTITRSSPVLGWSRRRASSIALLAAAVWLLHPLHVSTVLYAVQRMTQLSALFVMLGLAVFFYRRCQWLQAAPTGAEISRVLLCLVVFTLLAGFSKENGLLLPWLVVVTELCLFRFRVAGAISGTLQRLSLCVLLLPLIALLLLLVWDPLWLSRGYAHREFSLLERLLTQARVLWQYLGWLVLPNGASMAFYHDDIAWSRGLLEPLSTVFALLAWVLVGGLAWVWRDKLPLLGFALFWYLLAHSMESSIIGMEMVFEHRNYLPYVGPTIFLASLLWSEQPAIKNYRPLIAAGVLLVLAASLFVRSFHWSDEKRMAEYHYRHHPESLRSHYHLVSAYREAGLAAADVQLQQHYYSAARELSRRALSLRPDSIPALVLLAYFDGNSSAPGDAQRWYEALDLAVARPALSVADTRFLGFQNRCVIERMCVPPATGQLELLRRLVHLHPGKFPLLYQLVRYCLAEGDLACALEGAELLLAGHSNVNEALKQIYAVHVMNGDQRQAQAMVERILLLDRLRRHTTSLLQNSGRR